MLLDANANPKLYTNDGQSAEDLAYDGGFTIVSFASVRNYSARLIVFYCNLYNSWDRLSTGRPLLYCHCRATRGVDVRRAARRETNSPVVDLAHLQEFKFD